VRLSSIIFLLFFISLSVVCQDKKEDEKSFKKVLEEKTTLRGYIKDLHSLYFFDRAYLSDEWTFGADARTQVIYGSYPRTINSLIDDNRSLIDFLNGLGLYGRVPTSYGELFSGNPGPLDLHFLYVDQPEMVAWTDIDRLWLDWSKGKFELRIGKQRVNWGINWVWNPNDIFNTFNFTDFDYEERAASDAIRMQYYYNTVNKLELVLAAGNEFEQNTFGLLWKVNQWNYDFQFIGANYQGDWLAGFGWSGNVKNIGFKGESTYFFSSIDEDQGLVMSLGLDYSFVGGLSLQAEALYNNFAQNSTNGTIQFSQSLTPRTLSQSEYSAFFGVQGGLSPRSTLGVGFIYQGKDQPVYFAPSYSYSLAENVDLLLIGQFVGEQSVEFLPTIDSGLGSFYGLLNTRLKWSF